MLKSSMYSFFNSVQFIFVAHFHSVSLSQIVSGRVNPDVPCSPLVIALRAAVVSVGVPHGNFPQRAHCSGDLCPQKVHAALAMEEPAVERMKARLRDLFHSSQGNTGPLSDDVVAMIKEYQG